MFDLLRDQSLAPVAPGLSSRHKRSWIPDGVRGTAATIKLMQELVSRGKRDIVVREFAGRILRGEIEGIAECPSKNYRCYAESLYRYCRDKIKYAYDPHLVEYIEEPRVILQQTRIADCDSICVLMASMLENVGLETQFVTIKADPRRPEEFSHVYLRVRIPREGWIVLDATMPHKHFGWEPEGDYEKRYWPGSTDALSLPLDTAESLKMSGLGTLGHRGRGRRGGGRTVIYGGPSWIEPAYVPFPVYLAPPEQMMTSDQVNVVVSDDDMLQENDKQLQGLDEEFSEPSKLEFVRNLIDGKVTEQLRTLRRDAQEYRGRLEMDLQAAQRMPPGPEKSRAENIGAQAQAAYSRHMSDIQNAIAKHDELARLVQTISGGNYTPPQLGTLGSPIVIGGIAVGAIVASAALVAAMTALVSAFRSDPKSKGYLEQLEGVVRAGGGVVQEVGNTWLKVGFVAGVGALAYFLFKGKALRV